MSADDRSADAEIVDVVRKETALDLAAFRKFAFRVGDVDDDADLMEAAVAAADRIEEIEMQQRWLAQELGRPGGDEE